MMETNQTSFKIKINLHKKLKQQSLDEERTQSEIMNQAIEEYLNRYDKQERKKNRSELIRIN